MTALTQDLSIDSEIAHVDEALIAGDRYTIGNEVIRAGYAQIRTWDDLSGLHWYISRGQDHTTAAAHSSGATLTLARAYAAGGGGGPVDAADVTFTPNGSIAASDVQEAIQEVRDEAGAGVLLSVTVDLDAADIATLSSVPVEVVAAPGAGKAIVPVAASFQYKAGAVAFDFASEVMVGNGEITIGSIDFAALDDRLVAAGMDTADRVANTALNVACDGTDPDGAGDGTARLQVLYYVMDLA